jgi:alpha-glucosidase
LHITIGAEGSIQIKNAAGRLLRDDLPPIKVGPEVIHRVRLRSEEHIYGLGNRAVGFDLRGGRYKMWNRDPGSGWRPGDDPLYLCIPTYVGLHAEGSYLVFYENAFPAAFEFGTAEAPEIAEMRWEGGVLRYYLCSGPLPRALEHYTTLTGRPPLPPRWALGYHQSRWSYTASEQVREVVEGFRAHDLPLSAIHLDIDYMDGFRVFTVDGARFPDLAELSAELRAREIRLVAILDPGVKVDHRYAVFEDGRRLNVFCLLPGGGLASGPVWPGWAVFPDFTDPRARRWWADQYPKLLDVGIHGLWHDMNEPAVFAAWGDASLPRVAQHNFEGRGGTHQEAHNLYGLLMAQAGYEGLRRHRPDRRPFVLTRSGWAGIQRYAWHWTGDVESSWEALRQTVRALIGLGLSGVSFAGSDAGGFVGTPSPELYIRWLQVAAFSPFFRAHSAFFSPRREPWSFGEPWLTYARGMLKLRERLLPYWYTLAWHTTQTGSPLIRPLFWPNGDDPRLWSVDDAFFVGEALLVAPVLAPAASRRLIPLPKGRWWALDGDAVFEGPGAVEVDAPIDRIPVLVRAGAVLPMRHQDGVLVLHLYPPASDPGGGVLYSDAGDGYGADRVDRFSVRLDGKDFVVEWAQEGEYPFPFERVEVRVHGVRAPRLLVDENLLPEGRCDVRGPFRTARVMIPASAEPS